MKFCPPDPDIEIYKVGFDADDTFGRAATGKELSRLVETIHDPLVVALDGPWGSGKSYFLKRWVGEHRLNNPKGATTVYFDAFAHDFLSDPLVALTGVIGDEAASTKADAKWRKVQTAVLKLAGPVRRVGLAYATQGVSELTGPALDALLASGSKELENAAVEFWKKRAVRAPLLSN